MAAVGAGRRRTGKMASAARQRHIMGWVFLAPGLLIHVFVIAVPCIVTLALAFYSWNGLGVPKFTGLSNFRTLFTGDPVFFAALANNVRYMLMFLTVPTLMGLGAAVLIRSIRHGGVQMAYRTIFYLPVTISSVVVGRIWGWIYHPFYGINAYLPQVGLGAWGQGWLSDTNWALYSVAFADNWRWWGFIMVLFLAALQQIDPALYEAAQVDGANAWQTFWWLTIPMLRSTFVFVALTTVIGSFLVIDLIYIMTSGGPANATQVLAYWAYQNAVYLYNDGYASAIAVVLAAILSIAIGVFVYIRKKGWDVL
jgi:raffinose/stachyose/melibiose transport system permease protein